MKKNQLIEALQKIPGNPEVCIMDWRKSVHNASAEPNGQGIHPNFLIEFIKESKPFVAVIFENDDYNRDGTPNDGSSLYAAIKR